MRMKLAQRLGLVAGPGLRSLSLRSSGMIRDSPSSWRRRSKSPKGTFGVWWPTGLATLLYSKYRASVVHLSLRPVIGYPFLETGGAMGLAVPVRRAEVVGLGG